MGVVDTFKHCALTGLELTIVAKRHITPPKTPRISRLKSQILKPPVNDGEKLSSFFYFEILLAPSELLLPSTFN